MLGYLATAFMRFSLTHSPLVSVPAKQISTHAAPVCMKVTSCVFAEPLKKKKRMDPAVLKQREERKKKKLEKQIRRLEKMAKQLKPIDEIEVPLNLLDEKEVRTRDLPPLSEEDEEERRQVLKSWSRYKREQFIADMHMIDNMVRAQERALSELRNVSEELYMEAIQIDPALIPFKCTGPVRTPPIKGYDSPDGEYINVSKKWE